MALAAVAALLLSGCQLLTELNITVEEEGSGVIEFALGLDRDAVDARPELVDSLDLSHLADAGWEVADPRRGSDGVTWVRARHRFESPAQVASLVDDVAGPEGPLRGFALRRSSGLTASSFEFEGVVDFGRDRVASTVEDLAGRSGSDPGDDTGGRAGEGPGDEAVAQVRDGFGAALADLVTFRVGIRLPGDVESNAPLQASNGARWNPSVAEPDPVELRASSSVTELTGVVVVVGVGVVGAAAVLGLLVVVAARRRRAATASPAGSDAPPRQPAV